MDISIIVTAKLVLLLWREGSEGLRDITVGVFAADHEADLAGWVGGNSGVSVFDGGENFFAVLLQLSD
jgi:hypothetical protein